MSATEKFALWSILALVAVDTYILYKFERAATDAENTVSRIAGAFGR